MNRYDRQIRVQQIGELGQQKLKESRVMVIGCGALGTYAIEQLVRAGIGELILIDPDHVEESNLQRQTLFTEKDARDQRLKVEAAKEKLSAIQSTANIHIWAETFEQAQQHLLPEVDLILDCTDHFSVRQNINHYAIEQKIPFIFASCAGVSGQTMAISSEDGPCLACVFPEMEQLAEKSCDLLGVSTPIVPMIASLQVSLAMKVLIHPETVDWGRLYLVNQWDCQIDSFQILKAAHCPACSGNVKEASLPKTAEATVTKLCGENVYQLISHDYSLDQIETLCRNKGLAYHRGKLAIECQIDCYAMTFFKNGKVHCFDFPSKQAAQETFYVLLKGGKIE